VKRKKMNTKIVVALVLGIALVGLTGAASAAYYHIDGNYVYVDGAANDFTADTGFEVVMSGAGLNNNPIHMHNWVKNRMVVNSDSSGASNVHFGLKQSGASTLTIETDVSDPSGDNRNTFVSQDVAAQEIMYTVDGDAYDIDFYGKSLTHASTHNGILPIKQMAVWDCNIVNAGANVGVNVGCPGACDIDPWEEGDPILASIKSGNLGYECTTFADATMEVEHVLDPVTAGSGITVWSNAEGELWDPYGAISTDVEGDQDVWMWWQTDFDD
jgi:hypothetical protein